MSWRTVLITSRCKLDLKMGCMVIRGEEDTKRVFLDEIALLIIENTAVSLTCCLLQALTEKKIKVIFCDEKRSPSAELVPYAGSHDSQRKIKQQINWGDDIKGEIWKEIVADKICKQAQLLYESGKEKEAETLNGYIGEIAFADATNREGHAAKVYFNALFGMDFKRGDENTVNAALNYGYSLLLSTFSREISASGYLTQLGIFHDNVFNAFNLSSDLMEPFRVIVDRHVHAAGYSEFGTKEKQELLALLHRHVMIDGAKQTVLNAAGIYARSVFAALNDRDISAIKTIGI